MSSNASRVPGEVNSIDHFGLNVPSIPDAKSFFTAFELGNPQRIDECIRLYPDNAEWDALCDQRSRSSRVTRCNSVMKSAPSITFARVATGVTLALAVIAGISAAPRSAVADEAPIVFMLAQAEQADSGIHSDTLAGEASRPTRSGPAAGRQLIPAQPTDPQTGDPDPETTYVGKFFKKFFKQLMRSTKQLLRSTPREPL
jgi:hypothetical protein